MDSKGAQPHINMYLFSSRLPTHPGCCTALSRVSCATEQVLIGYPLLMQCCAHVRPKLAVVGQLLGCVWLFVTPQAAEHQASLSFTTSWSLLKLMSIESVMPCNHLILCHPLLLLSSLFPIIAVFPNELPRCTRWPKSFFSPCCGMQIKFMPRILETQSLNH